MPTVIQWLNLLQGKIEKQAAYATPYEQRYCNKWVLPFIAQEYKQVYGAGTDKLLTMLEPPRVGMAAIGIDALVERLTVLGAKPGDTSTPDDAATKVETAWRDCDLDVMHREAHREALIKGVSFAQVARSTDGRAVVGIEAAEQMAVHRMQAPPYDVDAALKISTDEWTGKRTARLWLPGRDIDLVETGSQVPDPEGSNAVTRWRVVNDQPSRLPGVPVVEFTHKARLLADPQSEIEPISSLVDIVDLIEGLMVFAGHFGAVPIRWGTGITVPKDPKDPSKPLLGADGKPILGFNPRADHMWVSTSKDAQFGQLTPASLATFVEWADHASAQVRARTAVASTYYSLDLKSHMSAELLKTDEAPMVRRVKSMGEFGALGQSWRRVFRLITAIENPGSRAVVVPRWGDPETRVESLAADALTKLVTSGLGVKVAAQKLLGWSPEEIQQAIDDHDSAEERAISREALANDPVLAALSKQTADVAVGA